jgi:hypothetical protein
MRQELRAGLRLQAPWRAIGTRGGLVVCRHDGLLLANRSDASGYQNAQLDDYRTATGLELRWRPPLRLTVSASVAPMIAGTAGFGFWNSPISPLGHVLPRPPAALWFFHAAPPSDLALARGTPGHGWKVASIDLTDVRAWRWAPLAPLVALANRWPVLEARVWPRVERALRIAERAIAAPAATPQRFVLEWHEHGARAFVDDRQVFTSDCAPCGPLGFVAWVDTQWMIASRHGRFGWGIHRLDRPQWLQLHHVTIEPLVHPG